MCQGIAYPSKELVPSWASGKKKGKQFVVYAPSSCLIWHAFHGMELGVRNVSCRVHIESRSNAAISSRELLHPLMHLLSSCAHSDRRSATCLCYIVSLVLLLPSQDRRIIVVDS